MHGNKTFLFAILMAIMAVQAENQLRKRPVYQVDEKADVQSAVDGLRNFWDAAEHDLDRRVLKGSKKGGKKDDSDDYESEDAGSGDSGSSDDKSSKKSKSAKSSKSAKKSGGSDKSSKKGKKSKGSKAGKKGGKRSKKYRVVDSGDLFDMIMDETMSMSFAF